MHRFLQVLLVLSFIPLALGMAAFVLAMLSGLVFGPVGGLGLGWTALVITGIGFMATACIAAFTSVIYIVHRMGGGERFSLPVEIYLYLALVVVLVFGLARLSH